MAPLEGLAQTGGTRVVVESEQLAGHIVRCYACLHANQAWLHIRKPRRTSDVRDLFAQHYPSSYIEVNQVRCILAGIDTNGDDRSIRPARHCMVLLLDYPTSMFARRREHGRSVPLQSNR